MFEPHSTLVDASIPPWAFPAAELSDLTSIAADKARTSFSENGFFVAQQGVPARLLNQLHADIKGLLMEKAKPGEDLFQVCARLGSDDPSALHRISQIIAISNSLSELKVASSIFWDLASAPEDRHGLRACYSASVIFGLPRDSRLVYNWHQESTYMPPEFQVTVNLWIPLFNPSSRANGAMSALRGSHKLGRLPTERTEKPANGFTSLIPQGVDELCRQYDEFHFECAAGDVVVFHRDLIHRSNYNSVDAPRFTAALQLARIASVPSVALPI